MNSISAISQAILKIPGFCGSPSVRQSIPQFLNQERNFLKVTIFHPALPPWLGWRAD